ncbi:Putative NADH dehydrogenase protein [Bradyrhizobium sp. ORS 285]|uniref:NAD(P)/FAD-dependent oxidoreductase n=1 Tax=Bradyrhizobium sp. ORS 285 TaxID=115808 RepID=UPI0002406733|nr:NAD(P)/FAD-dependent oxidoreductase [Bradyrhizobium sp. ORS 285]CCD84867.1 putative NADH dehydrogenase protein [Bradyrhizobium sp. ORS 285]SMX55672.1 Putative NADH dehydrogenase protein [Bradyrhizobium sp. ORS 285]
MNPLTKPSVVVVGAGFAGLEAVRALAHADVSVTLIDRKNHHCFQPLLYQVATAALSPADVAWPIRAILADQANVTVIMAEVDRVDIGRRVVVTSDGPDLPFDYLVLATGVTTSYFNHPEWARFAPGLKTIEDATRIRAQILTCFERAERTDDEALRQKLMTFVIVGGGPTGVEMAGSIADIARNVLAGDFRNIDPQSATVVLIEAGQRLLSNFAEELSDYTRKALQQMNVDVITGAAVTDCTSDSVTLSNGRHIACCCLLWAAGVRATPAASWIGAKSDRAGRIMVDDHLRVSPHTNIFAVGDIAAASSGGKPVPGLAPAAKQMGRYVGELIAGDVIGRGRAPRPFVYHHQGDLATIGRKSAVVSLKHLKLTGVLGWAFWGVVHIYFLIGLRNRITVALNWLWEYLTFQRGARLIS